MNPVNLYAVLGVAEDATIDDIKKAYRALAKKHHPDVNGGSSSSAEAFKRVTAAYEVLCDCEKRTAHDRELQGAREAERRNAAAAARAAERSAEAARAAAAWADIRAGFSPPPPASPSPWAWMDFDAAASVSRPVPAPAPRPSGADLVGSVAVGLGLFSLFCAAFAGPAATWDDSVARYRGPDGRFTSK